MNEVQYRQGVAAFILNSQDELLACTRGRFSSHDWQIPQGGIEENESIKDACFREVEEETGLKYLKILSYTQKKYKYQWPSNHISKDSKYIGQEHIYFLLRAKNISELVPTKSFTNYNWVSIDFLITNVIDFKKDPYINAWTELKNNF